MPIVQTSHGPVHYLVEGKGPSVLLLHPIGLDAGYWAPLSETLAPNYRVLCVDTLGHGQSADVREGATLEHFAAAIHAAVEHAGAAPAFTVGLSMGGMLAQMLALDHPGDVAGLVLAGTSSTMPDERRHTLVDRGRKALDEGMESMVDESITRWFSPAGRDSALAQRCAAQLRAANPHNWARSWRAMSALDALPRLGTLNVPTLVVSGSDDVSSPPAAGALTRGAIRGAEQVVLQEAAHFFPFERPDLFNPVLAGFLARHAR